MSEGIRDTAATARSQSVVHIQPRNHRDAARVIGAAVDRPAAGGSPDVLVIAPTADDAMALAEARAASAGGDARLMVPITGVARGRHLLSGGPSVIVGAPAELVPLVREAALRLGGVTTMVLAWPEEILASDQLPALESLVAEVPRSADRLAVVARPDPATDELLDRVMWRARRVDHPVARGASPVTLQYVVVPEGRGLSAVRAAVDGMNPDTTCLVTFSDAAEETARAVTRALGNPASVTVHRGVPDTPVSLAIVFLDVPAPADLQLIAGTAGAVLAVVDAGHVEALLAAAAGGATPLVWTAGLAAARSALDALRDTLRGAVANGAHTPWMPVVEPLLAELDPAEIAAAAVALLDRERRKEKAKRAAESTAPVSATPRGEMGEPERRSRGRPAVSGKDRRGEGPPGGRFARERQGRGKFGGEGSRSSGPRRDRDDRPRGPRRDAIDRVPRAAREGAEWAERGERLRNARKPRPDKRDT